MGRVWCQRLLRQPLPLGAGAAHGQMSETLKPWELSRPTLLSFPTSSSKSSPIARGGGGGGALVCVACSQATLRALGVTVSG